MSQFKKNLTDLPSVEHVSQIELFEANQSAAAWSIENKPGKSGSVAVYHFLKLKCGELTAASAATGLEIFAEHVAVAKEKPGAHPNIDFLLDVIKKNRVLSIQINLENE